MLLNTTELNQLEHFSQQQKTLFVGLSGGVDSVVLLDVLYQLSQDKSNNLTFNLAAIHVHHGLSKNANTWQDFCFKFCQQRNIPFQAQQVSLIRDKRQSLEALAREARYQIFSELSDEHSVLVTAQHLNDQAETFLLRLKRGSGPTGLSAMARLSDLPSQNKQSRILWRPLLKVSKTDILAYAKQHQLTWMEDESNLNNDFDRNFIRNQVLPLIETRWPEFQTCIARSAELCQQEQSILAQVAQQDLASLKLKNANHSIDLLAFNQLDSARQSNVLRYWLKQFSEPMPSQAVLEQIRQNSQASIDQQPKIKLGQGELWQYKKGLYYISQVQIAALNNIPHNLELEVSKLNLGNLTLDKQALDNQALAKRTVDKQAEPKTVLTLSNGQQLEINWRALGIQLHQQDKVTIEFSPSLKTKCRPKYRHCSKSIKQCLQELEIPIWQRPHIPYLFINNQLKAAIGFWECE
ncbi:tRNA lysidine(34) synthetase TilS [Catenovulum adriaticum]|uniref:tRNA(Ile)-lysidine synthase n=1 Tax=Catenovulum adriaticum TaxID=2984846 RepID=A0ABY7ASW0_9ALTE|nr:tRNA lysidine(34) synthetase TilS [Catenovulum sp. TS8]WAJ72362.1 tRNA lysidine(34) synthetase TilS [Catenovulum sp. TS8]